MAHYKSANGRLLYTFSQESENILDMKRIILDPIDPWDSVWILGQWSLDGFWHHETYTQWELHIFLENLKYTWFLGTYCDKPRSCGIWHLEGSLTTCGDEEQICKYTCDDPFYYGVDKKDGVMVCDALTQKWTEGYQVQQSHSFVPLTCQKMDKLCPIPGQGDQCGWCDKDDDFAVTEGLEVQAGCNSELNKNPQSSKQWVNALLYPDEFLDLSESLPNQGDS